MGEVPSCNEAVTRLQESVRQRGRVDNKCIGTSGVSHRLSHLTAPPVGASDGVSRLGRTEVPFPFLT